MAQKRETRRQTRKADRKATDAQAKITRTAKESGKIPATDRYGRRDSDAAREGGRSDW